MYSCSLLTLFAGLHWDTVSVAIVFILLLYELGKLSARRLKKESRFVVNCGTHSHAY